MELEHGITLLGRLGTNQPNDPVGSRRWVINDPTVSRTHCGIQWRKGTEPNLTHLSQTNDTMVNGQRVERVPLMPEHVVQIGLTVMRFNREEIPDGPGWDAFQETSDASWDAETSGDWAPTEASVSDGWNPT